MRYQACVFESSHRWIPALRRFGDQVLPSESDRLAIETISMPLSSSAMSVSGSSAFILWELPPNNVGLVLSEITKLQASDGATLQFLAYSDQAGFTIEQRASMDSALREIGITMTLAGLTELPLCLEMVKRHWIRHRPETRVTAAQEIWEQLPWEE